MKGNERKRIKTVMLFATVFFFLFFQFLSLPPVSSVSAFAAPCAYVKTGEFSFVRPPEELLLSSFSTRYDEEKENRSHNIRLACRLLNGCRVEGGGEFSFNARVGERTAARGFKEAAVISRGEFVPGVGGGVCQVSTTVYNAALLAGMGVTEVHAHSLKVGYVSPSFDAMVSGGCDLKFVNPGRTPVVVFARAAAGEVTVEFYGKGSGYSYRTKSVTVEVLPPPEPETVEGAEDLLLRAGKEGVRSEGFLITERRGRVKKTERIRRDFYAPVRAVEQRRKQEQDGQEKDEIFDNKFEENTQNN